MKKKNTFENRFDEICKNEKLQKEKKKEKFNENIKSHIVYMDENGKIYSKKEKENKENLKNLYIAKTVKSQKKGLNSTDIIILLVVILNLIYFLYSWFNYLGIV